MRNFIFLKIMTMYFALLMVIICSYHQKANEYITICIRHIVLKNKVNAARKSKVDDNTARMQSIKQLGV